MTMELWRVGCCALALSMGSTVLLGQEVLNTTSATQPAPGVFTFQSQFRFERLIDPDDGFAVRQVVNDVRLNTGLTRDLAVTLAVPVIARSDERGSSADLLPGGGPTDRDLSEFGIGDARIELKYRVYRNDTGPLDTTRVVLLLGAELPTSSGGLGSRSVDPMVGAALTSIRGRHGVGAAVRAQLNTGADTRSIELGQNRAELFELDLTYAYRVFPERFGAGNSDGSWYGVLELNSAYETNGDHEIVLAPAILFEGSFAALEFGLRVPLLSEVSHRAELDYGLTLGFRWLF